MKTKTLMILFSVIALFLLAGCPQVNPPGACTQEARQCPDGSYVGRTEPNCEFASCPNTTNCQNYSVDKCPSQCVICPPCAACSSISCHSEEFCKSIGFNRSWYNETVNPQCKCPEGYVKEGDACNPTCYYSTPKCLMPSILCNTTLESYSVVNASNQFAFELYAKYVSQDGNIFFSPYSISTALAMTYEGARGKTADEMASVFHFPKDNNTRRNGFATIYNGINSKNRVYNLSTANALWAQKDYKFLDEYTGVVENYYGGKVTNLDFVEDTENSRITINNWVEEQTNNKIKDILPPGSIDQMTRLVITNAVYFKAHWLKPFSNSTEDEDFRVNPGNAIQVKMMSQQGDMRFNYAETGELQIIELPYDGDEISMLILLPKNDNMQGIEQSLSAGKLKEWKSMLKETDMEGVYIPRFKFETEYMMADTLKNMGMKTAFEPEVADFSGMDGTKNLYISSVIHKAFVQVNETGTEAAAATAVIMGVTAIEMPPKPVFKADHPFIFLIQQKDTGNILFMGRVSNPNS